MMLEQLDTHRQKQPQPQSKTKCKQNFEYSISISVCKNTESLCCTLTQYCKSTIPQ